MKAPSIRWKPAGDADPGASSPEFTGAADPPVGKRQPTLGAQELMGVARSSVGVAIVSRYQLGSSLNPFDFAHTTSPCF
jgi:hypothetical protein